MLAAYTVAQVRSAEERLAQHIGFEALMQRAAAALAEALAAVPTGAAVVMLVGPGNNGGDALFAATRLLDRGVRVDLCLLSEDRVHQAGLAAALAGGASVVPGPDRQRYCVDALLGIGARPGLVGKAAQWAAWVADQRPWTLAVDVPSGVDVDGATVPGPVVEVDQTLALGGYKIANVVDPAATSNGRVELASLGVEPHLGEPAITALEPGDGEFLADLLTDPSGHKYTRGVVAVAAGSQRYPGAAHLAVTGAQGGPAGMIRYLGPADLTARVIDRAPEVVAGDGRAQARVIGSGGDPERDDIAQYVADGLASGDPLVLDAAAIDWTLLPKRLTSPVVLTPHAGELARVLGTERGGIEANPLAAAREAASVSGAVVLLKGPRTLIAHPDGRVGVNLSGSPWLATAGSGDVLAGLIGSLAATGIDVFEAARFAAFLHGAAAVAANPGGPVTASAVAAALPTVMAKFLRAELADVYHAGWR